MPKARRETIVADSLKEAKKQIKALIDIMDKRYKRSVAAGVPHNMVRMYERGQWARPSQVKSIQQAQRQIKEMQNALNLYGTVKERKIEVQRRDERTRQTLHKLGVNLSSDDISRLQKFWNMYSRGNKEASYYQVADTFESMKDDEDFQSASVEQLLDRWGDFSARASRAVAEAGKMSINAENF